MSRRVTQKTVAKEADVSQALVSVILNHASWKEAEAKGLRVAEETWAKVVQVAERLGYEGRGAFPARIGLDKMLVYIRPMANRDPADDSWRKDAQEASYGAIQNGLIEAASSQRFSLAVRLYEQPSEVMPWLEKSGIDGVFLETDDRELGEAVARLFPLVQVCRKVVSLKDLVLANQEETVGYALRCLQKAGHRRIGLLAAHPCGQVAALRARAYRDHAEPFPFQTCESLLDCRDAGDFLDRFLNWDQPEERPTAVIAEDALALRIQREALRRGLSLPADLSLVGIGNSSAASFSFPALTSVDIRFDEIARVAMALMAARLADRDAAGQKIEITPKLWARDSVAAPAVGKPARKGVQAKEPLSIRTKL